VEKERACERESANKRPGGGARDRARESHVDDVYLIQTNVFKTRIIEFIALKQV